MLRCLLGCALAVACAAASAPTQEQVMQGAARLYRARIAEIEQRYALDRDPVFLARVRRVTDTLLQQARRDYPNCASWSWEIHTTDDDDENASAMAGGKLLVGQPFVTAMGLNDAELAMLIAHELQHALQEHNLKEFLEAMRVDPAWGERPFSELEQAVDDDGALVRRLAPLNASQEEQADSEGLKLAWRAGWPADKLANYFRKIRKASAYANFDRPGYPAPARRWQAAHALAQALEQEGAMAPP
jgi:predicted Zn-dependent protease